MFSRIWTKKSTESYSEQIEKLCKVLKEADAVVIGAGAGLSTSAGLTYSGERFERYFSDFKEKYGIRDIYSGGFYPYKTLEEYWAWWSRHIFYNRYVDVPNPVYKNLLRLVQDKDYFVITTNVDHCFQKAGFNFIPKETMGCCNAANHVTRKRMKMRNWFVGCWRNKKICVFQQN